MAVKRSDERLAKLTKAIKESKKSLDTYKDTNNKAVAAVKLNVEATTKGLQDLTEKVNTLQTNLDAAQNKLDDTQKQHRKPPIWIIYGSSENSESK